MVDQRDPKLKKQIWRYFLSLFLSRDLHHLISLILNLFLFSSFFERFLGNLLVIIIFLGSNVFVNFFVGGCLNCKSGLSNFQAGYFFGGFYGISGIYGAFLAFFVQNFRLFRPNSNMKAVLLLNSVFVIVFGTFY